MNESETNELEMLRRRVRELELDAEEPTTRGHKRVIQIITGNKIYFCRTSEEEQIFSENNPGVKTETFHIELLNSTADKYLNDPENRKQFTSRKPIEVPKEPEVTEEPAEAAPIASPTTFVEKPTEPTSTSTSTWRQQAKELGIPLHKEPPGSGMRKKEDVLADIASQTTVSTS